MIRKFKIPVSLLAIFGLLFLSLPAAQAGRLALYEQKDLTIKEVVYEEDGTVRITFHTLAETLYYCPGVTVKVTEQGIELGFVRAHFKTRPKLVHRATPLPDSISRSVTIQTKGKPVFLRDGKKLVRLEAKGREK